MPDRDFWSRQRVLLTGHTGFKGTWLALWLRQLGAATTGYARRPEGDPNLFTLTNAQDTLDTRIGDICDSDAIRATIMACQPTVVIHMAAQALVRRSYKEPLQTLAANAFGTACLLEALRHASELCAVLVITTDKVYANENDGRTFRETDPLGGHDPYSASKAAAEIITQSFSQSFFAERGIKVATARAGNVIGGGDWAEDRLVPDLWRAAVNNERVMLRYPEATRPWQHVLDPLCGYLEYVERLVDGSIDVPSALNFGPIDGDSLTVADVAEVVLAELGANHRWERAPSGQPAEMRLLALDASLAVRSLGWRPRLSSAAAIAWAIAWYRAFNDGANARALTLKQIDDYENLHEPDREASLPRLWCAARTHTC